MKEYLINRLREPSTWAGLGVVISQGAQIAMDPTDMNAIATLVFGLVAVVKGDVKPKTKQ